MAPSSHEWQDREGITYIAQLQSPSLPCKSMAPAPSSQHKLFPHGPEGAASWPHWNPLHWDLLTCLWVKWRASFSPVQLSVWVKSENRRPNEIKSFRQYTGLLGAHKYSFCIADAPATVLIFSSITEKQYEHLWCCRVAVCKRKAANKWPSLKAAFNRRAQEYCSLEHYCLLVVTAIFV